MNRNAFYHYKVAFFDDYTEEIVPEEGITAAHSFCEALENISNYYGEEEIEQVQINCLSYYDGVIDLATLHAGLEAKGALD